MIKPIILDHPLVDCNLTTMRDKSTKPPEFRHAVRRLAMLLAYAATEDLHPRIRALDLRSQGAAFNVFHQQVDQM